MAAYAALVSLMHIIDNLQLHPCPPISLHKKQVQLLTQKITFLQEFLEAYNPQISYSTEADPLESRIADAAYEAEDAIESYIVDQITGKKLSLGDLYRALKMVIEEMALIETEAIEIKQTLGVQHQLHTKSTPSDFFKSSPIAKESRMMVGADDVKFQMMDKLTSDRRDLQIIPIVGMGGSGKTALAMNIYQDRLIKGHFVISAWVTISQEYSIREMLIQVLCELKEDVGQNLREDELGQILHQDLTGRRYLIILDDMWSIEAWDGIRRFLPNNENGSRVVVTTRLSNLASNLSNLENLKMSLLNEVDSWELLSKTVFGEKSCPPELEEIGKRIGKGCKGLPLSIVVIGGLLAKSKHTREFWESIEENLNSVVNLEDDGYCFKILHMSYKQLPVYLKPCFLYMGVFPEDDEISRSKLIRLWVAEGFLKPISGKSLEETAEVYLKDLADRNLILIDRTGIDGVIKRCKIHDLVRDLCLREADKERFYTLTPQAVAPNSQRRIVISKNEDINALSSMSLVRSLTWNLEDRLPPLSLRLLRILNPRGRYSVSEFLENPHELVNLRFLAFANESEDFNFHCSIWQLWSIQSLELWWPNKNFVEPTNIWHTPHIRHIVFPCFHLSDPSNNQDDNVLGNLQTLRRVENFKFSEQVVKRIPNIKKLYIRYCSGGVVEDNYCTNNLNCLVKLESLTCSIYQGAPDSTHKLICFPYSLKKLSLLIGEPEFYWNGPNGILNKIGVLPFLQKLTLQFGRFKEGQWETTEGRFRSLKFLALSWCEGLEVWTTESSQFPCLEQLLLESLYKLKEIPLDFAEVSTLRRINVYHCSRSAVISAKRILEEQEDLYGEEEVLQVKVVLSSMKDEALESLASPNFRIQR